MQGKITTDQFVEQFKNFINTEALNDNRDRSDDVNNQCSFSKLDSTFTENERDKCVKFLNRNKSPGVDDSINEYILESKECSFYQNYVNSSTLYSELVVTPSFGLKVLLYQCLKKEKQENQVTTV